MGEQIKEMGGACSTMERGEVHTGFLWGDLGKEATWKIQK